ncbi:unnamed protein product [Wickerhamomyces anomalus]
MAEIRRSSRANKGTNTRLSEQIKYEELIAKKSKKARRNSSGDEEVGDEEDEDGAVQCLVCGTTDDNYDEEQDDRDMIQCDNCQTWQHTECILGKQSKVIPDEYKCNVCDPANESYKNLSFKIDPSTIKPKPKTIKKIKKKSRRNSSNGKDEDEEDDDEFKDDDKVDDDDKDFSADDAEFKVKSERKQRKRSRSKSTDHNNDNDDDDDYERKKKSKSPKHRGRQSISEINAAESKAREIDAKTKDAVKRRFQTMFLKLLPGSNVNLKDENDDENTIESLSLKWATKLEDELYKVYHDPETLKLTPAYKEASARIYSNVIDVKNSKLRLSIINKVLPFDKLVRMPVQELLNPDLRKEKEEAIKESMTLATLEAPTVSNIRRTHKGDILLEKDDSNAQTQYDFNVGMNIDNDEKKFTKSKNTVINERKESSIYNNNGNNNDEDDEFDNSFDKDDNGDGTQETYSRDRSHSLQDDDAILQILGETEKEVKQQQDESNSFNYETPIWSGQTVFVDVTNFYSVVKLSKTNLKFKDYNKISEILIDHDLPLEIQGRLDLRKADDYIRKISDSRKLILLELENNESNDKNFNKLFHYFYSRLKVGVVKFRSSFIKDSYLIATKDDHVPRFFENVLNKTDKSSTSRLFIVFVVKQELIEKIDVNRDSKSTSSLNTPPNTSTTTATVPSFEFLSRLNPHELDLVNKIFDERPETRVDVNLLISYLQQKLKRQTS